MITIENFKKYLGYAEADIPAVKARGTLTLNRKPGVTGIIPIPSNLIFLSPLGNDYKSATLDNPIEINESQDFVPYFIESRFYQGAKGNYAGTNSPFQINQTVDFTATNAGPISGGKDYIPGALGLLNFEQLAFTDDRLQDALDIGTEIVKQMSGNSDNDLTDNILIREAIYLVAMYRLQNNNTNETSANIEIMTATRFFRDRTFAPLMRQVENLISQSGKRNLDLYFGDIH